MKVLFIHCAYKLKGGEDTVVEAEIKLLKDAGVDVELLLFSNNSNQLLNILQLPFNVSSYQKTKQKLKEFQPDIVHIHNFHFAASPSVFYAISKCKIPFVVTLHNYRFLCPSATLFFEGKLFLDSLNQDFPWEAVKKGVYKNSLILTFWLALSFSLHRKIGTWKLPKKYIVLTDFAKHLFTNSNLNIGNDNLVVKPNFCFAPREIRSEKNNFFLFIGRLSEEKGVKLLLQIASSTNVKIKIAGDGPLKQEVQEAAASNQNITYLGSKNKPEIFKLLSTATALIFPSTWYEGMPMTIIEAFSCGTPVIATKLGAMESMIVDEFNGLHFEAENAEDLKNKIQQWIELPEKQQMDFRQNALQSYEEYYTPEKNVDQLLSIYYSAVKGKTKKLLSPA